MTTAAGVLACRGATNSLGMMMDFFSIDIHHHCLNYTFFHFCLLFVPPVLTTLNTLLTATQTLSLSLPLSADTANLKGVMLLFAVSK